jgi:hypothetical protein
MKAKKNEIIEVYGKGRKGRPFFKGYVRDLKPQDFNKNLVFSVAITADKTKAMIANDLSKELRNDLIFTFGALHGYDYAFVGV